MSTMTEQQIRMKDFMAMIMESNTLSHHGVKDQKWGVRNGPPYPLSPEQKTKAKTKSEKSSSSTSKEEAKANKKAEKMKKLQEKREKEQEKALAKLEKAKAKYSKTATATYRHRDLFTQNELDDLFKKFQWEQSMRNLTKTEMDHGRNVMNTILGYGESAITGYNMVARLYNAFGSSDKTLPYIPKISDSKKK